MRSMTLLPKRVLVTGGAGFLGSRLCERLLTDGHEALRVDHAKLPSDDPRQRQPDITKARRVLGWEPTTPLRDGLVRTIEYFDAVLSAGATTALPKRQVK
jgi:nucleoside-diphosphate-sugar epimerase